MLFFSELAPVLATRQFRGKEEQMLQLVDQQTSKYICANYWMAQRACRQCFTSLALSPVILRSIIIYLWPTNFVSTITSHVHLQAWISSIQFAL